MLTAQMLLFSSLSSENWSTADSKGRGDVTPLPYTVITSHKEGHG